MLIPAYLVAGLRIMIGTTLLVFAPINFIATGHAQEMYSPPFEFTEHQWVRARGGKYVPLRVGELSRPIILRLKITGDRTSYREFRRLGSLKIVHRWHRDCGFGEIFQDDKNPVWIGAPALQIMKKQLYKERKNRFSIWFKLEFPPVYSGCKYIVRLWTGDKKIYCMNINSNCVFEHRIDQQSVSR